MVHKSLFKIFSIIIRFQRFETHTLLSIALFYIDFDTYIILRHYTFINFIEFFNINPIHIKLQKKQK